MSEPVRMTTRVHCGVERAFDVFAEDVARWVPTPEDGTGGPEIVERDRPRRVVAAWGGTELEVRFTAEGPAVTAVELEHRGWEALGELDASWPRAFARFRQAAVDPVCHEMFAKGLNQLVWSLLEQATRTPDEEERMVHAAHASAYHWSEIGGQRERVRADWLLSRVHAVAGRPEAARLHAQRSLAVCEAEGFGDFDLAYAFEAMARAAAVGGDEQTAAQWRVKAEAAGAAIADPEDREIFESDLAAPPW
jgi:hypothetical protein